MADRNSPPVSVNRSSKYIAGIRSDGVMVNVWWGWEVMIYGVYDIQCFGKGDDAEPVSVLPTKTN